MENNMDEIKEENISKECNCEDCNCCENNKKHGKHENKKTNQLEEKIKLLEENIKELEEKALREKADTINYRKRKDEEVNKILKYCNEDIIKDLLPTIDNFERAIKLDDNELNDELSKFLSGFKMIYCNLTLSLEKIGVKQIDGKNKPFDPTYHQAIMTDKVENMEPDMVIEVLQKGYMYKDKVIRPAMVKVSE